MASEYRAHIDAHRAFAMDALHVILGRKFDDQRWEAIKELSENPVRTLVDAGTEVPGFLIPSEAARALYDALGEHFGGASDLRLYSD